MTEYTQINNKLHIKGLEDFNLHCSCNCGQAFRWKATGENGAFCCVVEGAHIVAGFEDGVFTATVNGELPVERVLDYFDTERDYSALESRLLADKTLDVCVPYASGIRIFRQEPFETLISFIISANNNIKRISRSIERLCEAFGKPLEQSSTLYAFPTPQTIADISIEELYALGMGYRAPYIKHTAHMVADGFDLSGLQSASYGQAKKTLCVLPGVGPKVADCVLLFSLGHTQAFPMDVWMKRAVSTMFFNGKPPLRGELETLIGTFGNDAGIVQQYIFHYARETGLTIKR